MLGKTYAAFKAVSAPEANAQAAAEELADYEDLLASTMDQRRNSRSERGAGSCVLEGPMETAT